MFNKVGPSAVVSKVITYNSTYTREKKQLPIYKAICRGYNSIYNW